MEEEEERQKRVGRGRHGGCLIYLSEILPGWLAGLAVGVYVHHLAALFVYFTKFTVRPGTMGGEIREQKKSEETREVIHWEFGPSQDRSARRGP